MLFELFLIFLKIGLVAFGGGYGIVAVIKDECLNHGWLTEEEVLNFIAVSESTPGPIAVNMATFVGSSQGGILGAFLATLGVVLPAFIIMILIVIISEKIMSHKAVKSFIKGVNPAIIALIIGTSITIFLKVIFNISSIHDEFSFNYIGLIILGIIILINILFTRITKKKISPIILIIISGILGIIFYM